MTGIIVLCSLTAAAIGVVIGYLFAERRSRSRDQQIQTAVAVAEQRCADLSKQLEAEKRGLDELRAQLMSAEKQQAGLSAQLVAAQENLTEQKKLLDDAQAKLRDAFATVSAEALAKNNEAFLHLAKQRFSALSEEAKGTLEERKAQIEGLLKPMHELLN